MKNHYLAAKLSLGIIFTLCQVAVPVHAGDTPEDPHPGLTTVPVTGTLPVMHINTADNQVIDQKTSYIDASYWIEANDIDGYESVGSPEKPLALGIRGRGNSSWTYDKKPYKL